MNIDKTLSGVRSTFSCQVLGIPAPFPAEHYQSLEIAFSNVGQHYLKVDLLRAKFCNDIAS